MLVIGLAKLNQWAKEKQARKYRANYKYLLMYSDAEQLAQLSKLIEEGKIRSVIDKTFPLDQVREAFGYGASGRKNKLLVD